MRWGLGFGVWGLGFNFIISIITTIKTMYQPPYRVLWDAVI
ncbi:hypothetical protein PROSTU_04485 [Providencia stuartii ATCC 25827]|uniref:Uncharacterized protein n=1 Tax=Providencia stuartii ATCC 25827 TaxID=471874 RepID=A0AA86YRS9_PROST|nr:hypothetical protein PROSTU_04485 [Providencia stuartii ATCC 25827]